MVNSLLHIRDGCGILFTWQFIIGLSLFSGSFVILLLGGKDGFCRLGFHILIALPLIEGLDFESFNFFLLFFLSTFLLLLFFLSLLLYAPSLLSPLSPLFIPFFFSPLLLLDVFLLFYLFFDLLKFSLSLPLFFFILRSSPLPSRKENTSVSRPSCIRSFGFSLLSFISTPRLLPPPFFLPLLSSFTPFFFLPLISPPRTRPPPPLLFSLPLITPLFFLSPYFPLYLSSFSPSFTTTFNSL